MELKIVREARLVWIHEGQNLREPDGWRVIAVVSEHQSPRGGHSALVVQERELI